MSCQQVPSRLADDPYTFTEPPPVNTSVSGFCSSQFQKYQPILSNQQTPVNRTAKIKPLVIKRSPQQITDSRPNGGLTAVSTNGVHKLPYSPAQAAAAAAKFNQTKLASKQRGQTTTSCQLPTSMPALSLPIQFQTNANTSPHLYTKPQNIYQSAIQQQHKLPQQQPHQYTLKQQQQPQVQHQQTTPHQQHLHTALPQLVAENRHEATNTVETNGTHPNPTSFVVIKKKPKHSFNTLDRNPLPVDKNQAQLISSAYSKSPVVTKVDVNAVGVIKIDSDPQVANNNVKRADTFLTPAPAKKPPQSSARTKRRTHSQSSHHESLQRIQSTSDWWSRRNVDNHSDAFHIAPCAQSVWYQNLVQDCARPRSVMREERLEFKRESLRRQALQLAEASRFRSSRTAKQRIACLVDALERSRKKPDTQTIQPSQPSCIVKTCNNEPIVLTAYCYQHIGLNQDQLLFKTCTAKFSDNSQCQLPVFDVLHDLSLCAEHAKKRENYMLQVSKPKVKSRKKPKSSPSARPPKSNKKKKQRSESPVVQPPIVTAINKNQYYMEAYTPSFVEQTPLALNGMLSHHNDTMINASQPDIITQDLICENSSAYESSEDTGVGGLSESEMLGHDGMEIPLGDTRLLEEHDLNNVLNHLPDDAFALFTTGDLHQSNIYPTLKEQEDLDRRLIEADDHLKSLEQFGPMDDFPGTNFLGDFLDVDESMMHDSDICGDDVLHSNSDIRGLVHT